MSDVSLSDDDGASYDDERDKGVNLTTLQWDDKARALSVTGSDKSLVKTPRNSSRSSANKTNQLQSREDYA